MPKKWLITGVILLGVVFLFVAKIVKERAFSYGYDPKADYYYQFDSTDATILKINIKNGQIAFPQIDVAFNTAFLEINLKSTITGYFKLPELVLKSDSIEAFQNFESGVKGIRYVNLSEFIQKGKRKINLETWHCNITGDSFRLILYKNSCIQNVSVLVLSPHPDDAELAAFGLYSSNKNCYLATITAGDAGKRKYCKFYKNDSTHYLKKGHLRVWNSLTVPLLAGLKAEHIFNLGYFDGSLQSMYSDDVSEGKSRFIHITDIHVFRSKNLPEALKAKSNWRSLVNDIKYLLLLSKPDIIVTPYPAIDFHFDHKFTTIAMLQAIKELNATNVQLWMYTNHYAKPEYYPLGKSGSLISVPPYFEKNAIYFNRIFSYTLDNTTQIDKLFSLDAMNDLRLNAEWVSKREIYNALYNRILDNLFQRDFSYYRRAVRNNELFFVVDAKNVLNEKIYPKIVGLTK